MSTNVTRSRNTLQTFAPVVGATLVLLAALPVLIFLGWTARFAVLALIPIAFVGAFHPRVRRWLSSEMTEVASYRGLHLPTDVALTNDHTWVRPKSGKQVKVGVDDLMQRALGPVDSVVLPEPGVFVEQGDPLFTLKSGPRELTIYAPMDGTVLHSNGQVGETPSLINDRPYHGGWITELQATSGRAQLNRGSRALNQFCGDIDRVLEISGYSQAGLALAQDGGELAEDLHLALGEEAWHALSVQVFGQRM